MDTAEIRRRFLAHFEATTAHQVVPSASLLLDDPNLLFVNAGMVPFKPYFLGQETPPYDARGQRAEVRAHPRHRGGRQDHPARHVLPDVRQLLLRRLLQGGRHRARLGAGHQVRRPTAATGLDESRLYAERLRRRPRGGRRSGSKVTGLPDDRIVRLGKKENYWSHGRARARAARAARSSIDRGPDVRRRRRVRLGECRATATWSSGTWSSCRTSSARSAARTTSTSAGRCRSKNIDTGMGLERVAFLLQGKDNIYEIDEIYPVIEKAAELSGSARYGARATRTTSGSGSSPTTSAAAMMLIGDGVTPGNEARGYVLRRLLRRAVRSMRLLGVEDRTLPELLPVSRDKMALSYPELAPRLGADLDDRLRRGGRVPADAAHRHDDLRPRRAGREGRRPDRSCPAARRSRCTTPTASRST